ncbi:tRNA cyclic N6-threonylcarbamoyladenosine(37) synthase TcdA [Dokdonella sp.]|uniref:tRNA cyclic N6-threonylcarbamoyladenosine(37) synthase TcdA n=1 Tax=Dokdonella sp. TaxID=2291710 RepID=UPI0025C5D9DB|nr:tRNA cyclic N6-threonylcarbamoyladenosine(37) synthase TcdA [Dokdonella sp.]MBX3692594.1 tRNA cyclic N6-threonylcarbamoyladenosine(37) synthase TcdA [Dokdonella sp.]
MNRAIDDFATIDQRFHGVERLYGAGAVARFARARVAVVGIGGVGSWIVEALARSGVGRLVLIDADDICLSNTNRQLHALEGHYGQPKVEVMAARARAINPRIEVEAIAEFLTPSNLERLLGSGHDLVIDACDAFRVKVETIAWCRRRKQPLVVVGSAGGRVDPTLIRVRDLSKTEHDALLALVRKKLREEFGFPRGPKRYFSVPAVYSLENVRYPQADGSVCGTRPVTNDGGMRLDCGAGLGAATHVTASFAFAAVARALEKLLDAKDPQEPVHGRPGVATMQKHSP